MTRFLDLAGLIALWGKIKNYVANYFTTYVGDGKLFVNNSDSDDGEIEVISANSSSNKLLAVMGESGFISTSVDGGVNDSVVVNINHSTPSGGSNLTTTYGTASVYDGTEKEIVSGITITTNKGHITGISATKLKIPGKATTSTFGTIKVANVTNSALTLTSSNGNTANRFYGVQLDSNGVAFVNVPWTDSLNVNDADLIFAGDSGSATVFNADEENDHTVTFLGGNKITTQVIPALAVGDTSNTVKIDHDTVTTTTSDNNIGGNYPHFLGSVNVVSGVTLTTDGYGHVTNVALQKSTIPMASLSEAGLMSASDKQALDNINTTIATALTSAITPSGTVTASEFATLVTLSNTILSSSGLGNLYTISTPLVIGATESGDTTFTNAYTYFVEGTSLTESGNKRYEIPAGTNLLVVNTGTAQSPSYKIDIMGTYDNTYWAKNELKPIPVNTSDSNYTSGDQTIDSICV